MTDACRQLFGGYGYMAEYPIARLYADARIQRIYGSTTEIMKDLIARKRCAGRRHWRAYASWSSKPSSAGCSPAECWLT